MHQPNHFKTWSLGKSQIPPWIVEKATEQISTEPTSSGQLPCQSRACFTVAGKKGMEEESIQVSDTSFLLNTLNLSSRKRPKKHRNIVASQFSPVLFLQNPFRILIRFYFSCKKWPLHQPDYNFKLSQNYKISQAIIHVIFLFYTQSLGN